MGTPSKEMYDKVLEQQLMTIAPLQERFYGSKYFTGLPDEIKIMQRLPQYKDVAPPGKDGCMGRKGRWDRTLSHLVLRLPRHRWMFRFFVRQRDGPHLFPPPRPSTREDNFIFLLFDFFYTYVDHTLLAIITCIIIIRKLGGLLRVSGGPRHQGRGPR
jgi:hypothetical protein